jgi:hypothetical protein
MPTTNFDSSLISTQRKAKALYAYNNTLQTAKQTNASVRREQLTTQTLDVVTLRKQGGCLCGATGAS